jgi:hypothetical protein
MIMTASSVSRKTMKKMGTLNKLFAMVPGGRDGGKNKARLLFYGGRQQPSFEPGYQIIKEAGWAHGKLG